MPDRHLTNQGGLLRRITPGMVVVLFALVMTACILGVVVWKALEARSAALAGGATVKWDSILDNVVVPMLVSPVLGLVGGLPLMTAILWPFRRPAPGPTARHTARSRTSARRTSTPTHPSP